MANRHKHSVLLINNSKKGLGVAAAIMAVFSSAALPIAVQGQSGIEPFETWGRNTWQIGAEKFGSFTKSDAQAHSGRTSGMLSYDLPAVPNNYIVFRHVPAVKIAGEPQSLELWVLGDGSKNFLNIWVQDASKQLWQFSFGRIEHTGWSRMVASLNPNLPWPTQPIDNPNAPRTLAYPLRFYALVLDGWNPDVPMSGTIFVDDLATTDAPPPPPPPTIAPTPLPTAIPTPKPDPFINFYADESSLLYGGCTWLRWIIKSVNGYFLDGAPMTGDSGERYVCPQAPQQTFNMRVLTDSGDRYQAVTINVAAPPALCTNTSEINFGEIGHYSGQSRTAIRDRELRLTNCGGSPLMIQSWRFLVGNRVGGVFWFDQKNHIQGLILSPGQQCLQPIHFSVGGEDGWRSATLELGTNSPQSPTRVSLRTYVQDVGPAPDLSGIGGGPLGQPAPLPYCSELKK